ncbi:MULTISPECIES: CaiB/BaiF CoA transferase family protein [Brevibacterium]|uniref:CoA transferase n=1 Tax=Brevibacterium gallinarum TaxID=2762220 RepID=A0ABR8WXF0_9MICO|nr:MULTISPECIES: CoA transferase [Brevibacterium]MBD8021622.1 CoA transferase [Brevibacterium gallinarum]MCT1872600.1 CoA transferase [Brevibacterium luteolum]MCT1890573.1 CoA transferase [Brevibacterium luteolum]MCT1893063.1 CoA transferase [Brevibacterium luteolum]MCT1923855.1 CoA transferase [Brevibacterium luteolum]
MSSAFPESGPGPLSGIVVADFTRVLAGPYATMMLADMGATVIKVEGPTGDDTRHWKPPAARGTASYYQAVNRNKYSVVLDLRQADDLAAAKRLATRSDVFIHNFKPGSIEKFGLGYEDVRALRADIVYAHISGFGTSGKGRDMPGYDVLVQGMAGLMDMNGELAGSPVRSGVSIFDLATGMVTAFGIAAALRHRELTGEGQLIENNLMANAIFTMANQYQVAATTDVRLTRSGKEHGTIYPYHALPTADGELIVVGANDGQFARLCQVLEIPHVAQDERFSTAEGRNVNRDALRPILEEALAKRGKDDWFTRLSAAGLPCAPVQSVNEGLEMAPRLGIDPVWQTPDPQSLPTVRNSLQMTQTPATYRKEPPALGEDTEFIRDWLG